MNTALAEATESIIDADSTCVRFRVDHQLRANRAPLFTQGWRGYQLLVYLGESDAAYRHLLVIEALDETIAPDALPPSVRPEHAMYRAA